MPPKSRKSKETGHQALPPTEPVLGMLRPGLADPSQSHPAQSLVAVLRKERTQALLVQQDLQASEVQFGPERESNAESKAESKAESEARAEAEPEEESRSKPEPDDETQLSARKAALLHKIQANWDIKNIREMFTADSQRKSLQQTRGPNNDFFEAITLALIQKLSCLTRGRREDIKVQLSDGWDIRYRGRPCGVKGIQRRVGRDDTRKNRNLRNDLRLLIKNEKEVVRPEVQWEDESGDDEAEIKRLWSLGDLTEIMPEHSYPPLKTSSKKAGPKKLKPKTFQSEEVQKPVQWPSKLLQLVHELAFITPDQQDDVKDALSKAFKNEHSFKIQKAIGYVASVQDQFDAKQRPKMIGRMHDNWDELQMSDFPSHAFPETSVDLSDWPIKLFLAMYALSDDSKGQYNDAIARLGQSFRSAKRYSLSGSVRRIKNVHASFVGDEEDPDISDEEEAETNGTIDEAGEAEIEIEETSGQCQNLVQSTGKDNRESGKKRKAKPTQDTPSRSAKMPRILANVSEEDRKRYMDKRHEIKVADGEIQLAALQSKRARADWTLAYLSGGHRTYIVPKRRWLEAELRVKELEMRLMHLEKELKNMTKEWSDESTPEQSRQRGR